MNVHPFWSISTLADGAGATALAGAFSSHTTAFLNSFCGDNNRSPASFWVPHTYWSMVTSTFFCAGTEPTKTTLPLMEAPWLMPGAQSSPKSSADKPPANGIPFIRHSSPVAPGGCRHGAKHKLFGTRNLESDPA